MAKFKKILKERTDDNKQYGLYGKDHLWILKPGRLSRGRGIEMVNDYDAVLQKYQNHR